MRINNISNKTIPTSVKIVLPKKSGGYINITLPTNHSVYGEIMDNNTSLRIYKQKGLIEIIEESKPENLEYYKVYNNSDINSTKIPDSVKKEISESIKRIQSNEEEEIFQEEEIQLDEFAEEIHISKSTQDDSFAETGLIEIEIIVPEHAIKNKGGRPKGAKNKPKKRIRTYKK